MPMMRLGACCLVEVAGRTADVGLSVRKSLAYPAKVKTARTAKRVPTKLNLLVLFFIRMLRLCQGCKCEAMGRSRGQCRFRVFLGADFRIKSTVLRESE